MKKLTLKQKRRKQRSTQRKPINVVASALTTAGLYCGVVSIFKAIDQDFKWAAYYIILAQIFDIMDGTFAKLTKTVSDFGKQLDSLADLASFGVAPAVLIYTAYLHEAAALKHVGGKTGATMAIIFVICAALRLARFNVYQSEIRDYFVGLPTPAAAVCIATFVLFTIYFELQVAHWVLTPLTLGLAYLMVSNYRYPKDILKDLVLAPKNAFRLLVLCGIAIAVFHKAMDEHSPAIALFPLAAGYVLYGVGDRLYFFFTRRYRQMEKVAVQASGGEVLPPEGGEPSTKSGDLL
ncbi:MAG: CDP-diacylglycerol--serine O-phosphatidyltransferase [Candidatus Hydrogenedentales bacterium]|jgi:CDP-diacylglycerol--serine O-phosphatidyltransferase